MILGFFSACLVLFGKNLASICVNSTEAFLTCPRTPEEKTTGSSDTSTEKDKGYGSCPAGKEPWVSEEGLKHLDIFIFFLALLHIVFSILACSLAYLKVMQFKKWEDELHKEDKDCPARPLTPQHAEGAGIPATQTLRTAHFTDRLSYFRKRGLIKDLPPPLPRAPPSSTSHVWAPPRSSPDMESNPPDSSCSSDQDARPYSEELSSLGHVLVTCLSFFSQLYRGVKREEYFTVRKIFLNAKGLPQTYNFYQYLQRTMMEMFASVVGTTWWLWSIAALLLLLNFMDSLVINYISIVPPLLSIIIGTKMQASLWLLGLDYMGVAASTMKRKLKKSKATGEGETNGIEQDREGWTDKDFVRLLFWAGKPRIILVCIHYIIFQCAFEVAYVIWALGNYGRESCVFDRPAWVAVRLSLSVLAPFMASYVTLPVFGLLNASNLAYKKLVLSPRVTRSLQAWIETARNSHTDH